MKAYTPGLLERLMDERRDTPPGTPVDIEQFKDGVARDLEALLNTRIAVDARQLDAYPLARTSILHYGLLDFAGLCLSSSIDRAAICASIEAAVAAHEPRLCEVRAVLELAAGDVNRLQFSIHARLALAGHLDPVNFNAILQPSSLHYEINHKEPRWTSTSRRSSPS